MSSYIADLFPVFIESIENASKVTMEELSEYRKSSLTSESFIKTSYGRKVGKMYLSIRNACNADQTPQNIKLRMIAEFCYVRVYTDMHNQTDYAQRCVRQAELLKQMVPAFLNAAK